MTLYLFNFNNYYNRIVKRFETVNEYISNSNGYTMQSVAAFNPADEINTRITINDTINYNYLLVVDENDEIISRWYILDGRRLRQGQYELSLMRDVIADWYNEIVNAPCFIEKATLSRNNPLIFNREDMSYNQIKTQEEILTDNSSIPWIVGYINKDWSGEIDIAPIGAQVDYELDSLDEYEYNQYLVDSDIFLVAEDRRFHLNWYDNAGLLPSGQNYSYVWDDKGLNVTPSSVTSSEYIAPYVFKEYGRNSGYPYVAGEDTYTVSAVNVVAPYVKRFSWSAFSTAGYTDAKTTYDNIIFQREEGKVIKVGEDYYRVHIISNGLDSSRYTIANDSALGNRMRELADLLKQDYYFNRTSYPSDAYELEIIGTSYSIQYERISVESLKMIIPGSRLHSRFLPYDIFCIPYGTFQIGDYYSDKEYGLILANEIIKQAGKENLYDIQLLPYCPLQDRIQDGYLTFSEENGDLYLTAINNTEKVYSGLFWVDNPNFSITIQYNITVPDDAIEFKIANECNTYRIVSPNYNGQFEFSVTKNGGLINFLVDCSYKPYTPYIKVSPQFGGLYGQDFDDARGMICGGDFSLTQVSDAWISYQNQNKNYQTMFDREIENMDINNSIARRQQNWAIATGALQAGVTSGVGLGMVANPAVGAAVGVVGTAASLAGGLADYRMNEQLRQEARDYRIDQFGYQLGNIKALPLSLTKVSALNKNNKLFPFVEYYTATEVEKQALRDKLKYNGMTTMAIGTIANYQLAEPSYIKGRLIRLEDIAADYHVVNTIANELNQGVFI